MDSTTAAPVDAGKQGIGGREATGEPDSSKAKVLNGDQGASARWVKPGFEDLSKKVLAARASIGRPAFAEWASSVASEGQPEPVTVSQSAVWRFEQNRITHGELDLVKKVVAAIDAGRLPASTKKAGRTSKVAQALELLEKAAEDKQFSKVKLIEELRAVLAA
jgi:hypothetical protein